MPFAAFPAMKRKTFQRLFIYSYAKMKLSFLFLVQVFLILKLALLTLSLSISLPFPKQIQAQTPLRTLESPDCDGSGIIPDPSTPNDCDGNGLVPDRPHHDDKTREGFKFQNPSTNCKYVSQPYIWDSFKILEKDMTRLFTLIHKNVSFTVVGHHPIAGHYHDLMHFYVNALRRVSMCFVEHADLFEIHPVGIHGGCEYAWSVQEVLFKGVMNSGQRLLSPSLLFFYFFIFYFFFCKAL